MTTEEGGSKLLGGISMNTPQQDDTPDSAAVSTRNRAKSRPVTVSIVRRTLRTMAACIGLVTSAFVPVAFAADPLLSLVGPDEWNLPILQSKNLFLDSGLAQVNSSFYDNNGHSHSVPVSDLYGTVVRFAHMFAFDSLPGVGFGVEYLQPVLDIERLIPGQSITGLADPLFELGVYFKPVPGLTLGYLNVPSLPMGSVELSKHFWSDASTFIWNYHTGKFGFNGTAAIGISSTQHSGGKDTHIGNWYGTEVTALYEVTRWLAPFIGFTYHKNEGSHDAFTGAEAPGQSPLYSCLLPGGCHEELLGGGVNLHIAPKHTLSLWYYTGIEGSNVVKNNSTYLLYTHPF